MKVLRDSVLSLSSEPNKKVSSRMKHNDEMLKLQQNVLDLQDQLLKQIKESSEVRDQKQII